MILLMQTKGRPVSITKVNTYEYLCHYTGYIYFKGLRSSGKLTGSWINNISDNKSDYKSNNISNTDDTIVVCDYVLESFKNTIVITEVEDLCVTCVDVEDNFNLPLDDLIFSLKSLL